MTAETPSDLLRGIPEIAAFLGEPERRTYHMCVSGTIPAFMVGGRWVMRRSTYLAELQRREAQALARCRLSPAERRQSNASAA
jgi:hypothetical protein